MQPTLSMKWRSYILWGLGAIVFRKLHIVLLSTKFLVFLMSILVCLKSNLFWISIQVFINLTYEVMIKGRSFSHLHSNLNIFLWKLKLLLSIFAYFRKWFVLHTNMPDTFVIFIKMYFLKLHNTLWSLLFILLILHINKFFNLLLEMLTWFLVWLDHSIKNEGSIIHASIHIKYCSCVCGKLDFITSEWKQQYPVALSLLSGCIMFCWSSCFLFYFAH